MDLVVLFPALFRGMKLSLDRSDLETVAFTEKQSSPWETADQSLSLPQTNYLVRPSAEYWRVAGRGATIILASPDPKMQRPNHCGTSN